MGKCYVTARVTVKTGMEEALREAALRNIPVVRAEKGCIRYDLLTLNGHPEVLLFDEVWEDRAALDAHAAAPHMVAYRERIKDMLACPTTVDIWSAVDAV